LTSIRLSRVSGEMRESAFAKAVRVALVSLFLFQTPGCSETSLRGSPNLVLITVDTLRADFLECYGGPPGTGEALCQTLERGVRYDWAFSTAPYTVPSVAKLLAELEKRDPKAGILLTADHGEALGEDHYYFCHGHSLALDQIRVPLLWRPPGGTTAETRSVPVSLLDVAPTLLVSAGLPVPVAFEGQTLEWARPEGSSDRVLFSEHPQRYAAIVGNRYYAKDVGDLTRAGRDPNTMGRLRPLASRQAILGELVRGLPEYSDGAVAELDLLIDQVVNESAEVSPGSLDEATRARLKALGYID
jgi:hypothetical protein